MKTCTRDGKYEVHLEIGEERDKRWIYVSNFLIRTRNNLRATKVEGLKEEVVHIHENTRKIQFHFYQSLLFIQQSYHEITSANENLIKKVTMTQDLQSSLDQLQVWEDEYGGMHGYVLRITIKENIVM